MVKTLKAAKQLARAIQKEYGCKYTIAQNIVAVMEGHRQWKDLLLSLETTDPDGTFERKVLKRKQKLLRPSKFGARVLRANKRDDSRPTDRWTYETSTKRFHVGVKWKPIDRVAARVVGLPSP